MQNANNIWIPADVKYTKAKYICVDSFSGGTPSTNNNRYYENGTIPWIASGKCQDCDVVDETTFITKEGIINSSTRLIKPNTPLIAMTGATCGKAGFLKIPACANQSVYAFEVNKENDPRFFFYSIIAGRDSILQNQLGGAQAGINGVVCKNIFLPSYSLKKQKEISRFLDTQCLAIENLISHEKEQIDSIKNFQYRTISEVILKGLSNKELTRVKYSWVGIVPQSWFLAKIGAICYTKGRIGWQGLTASEYTEKGPYLITGTDFDNGSINWVTCEHITEERYKEAVDIQVKDGDLLITKDGTVGKVAIVTGLNGKASLNSGVLLIRDQGRNYLNKYLYYVLRSSVFWDWFKKSQKGNSTIIHLYQEQFRKFIFPLPPIDEQKQIVDYLDRKCSLIEKLIELKERKIELLELYKKSLIYECVTGKKEVPHA